MTTDAPEALEAAGVEEVVELAAHEIAGPDSPASAEQ
jgi:hypothetical protein